MTSRTQQGVTESRTHQPDFTFSLAGLWLCGLGMGVDAALLTSSVQNGAGSGLECIIQAGLVNGPTPNRERPQGSIYLK